MSVAPTPSLFDRLLLSIRQIIRGELVELSYLGVYEYSVVTVTNASTPMGPSCLIDATPVDPTVPVPPVSMAPVCPGLLAEAVVASEGMLCRVRFVNGKPSRPEVIGFIGGVDASGALMGPGGSPAAYVNSSVTVAFPPLMQVAGTLGGVPFVGILTITQAAVGVISTGSTKLTIGG
jgi:hypothetical protein